MKNKQKVGRTNNELYLVCINWGGFLHDKVYHLKNDEVGYYTEDNNTGFTHRASLNFGVNKTSDGCWYFISASKDEADVFFLGAKTAKEFLIHFMSGEHREDNYND